MLVILAIAIVHSIWSTVRRKRRKETLAIDEEAAGPDRRIGIVIAAASTVIFAVVYFQAQNWPSDARFFPILICAAGTLIALAALVANVVAIRSEIKAALGISGTQEPYAKILIVMGMLFAYLPLTMAFGQVIAIPVMTAAYLWLWGRERWPIVVGQAVAAFAVLYLMFEKLLHVVWYPAPFGIL